MQGNSGFILKLIASEGYGMIRFTFSGKIPHLGWNAQYRMKKVEDRSWGILFLNEEQESGIKNKQNNQKNVITEAKEKKRDIQKVFGFSNRVLPMKNKSNQHSINKTKQKQRLTVYPVLVYYHSTHLYHKTFNHQIFIKHLLCGRYYGRC